MSDDEESGSDSRSEDNVWVEEKEQERKENERRLGRGGNNVGRSLRRIADDDDGQVVKKSKVYDDRTQLATGARASARLADLDDEGSDLEQREVFDDDAHVDNDEDEQPDVIRTTMRANPAHVRTQRKNEADILGIRIRFQLLLTIMFKLPQNSQIENGNEALRSTLQTLIDIRVQLFKNGHTDLPAPRKVGAKQMRDSDLDAIWHQLEAVDEDLWERHHKIIGAWERRAHLTVSRKKELKAMNKSVLDQTQAALARRAEIDLTGTFQEEDSDFYQSLLRDFVQSRSADPLTGLKAKSKSKRQAYLSKQKDKLPKVNYDVHEKLVNFGTPVSFPAPPTDIDMLIKSLFKT